MKCPNCGGPLKPLSWPALSVQCYHCNAKYLCPITTANTTALTFHAPVGSSSETGWGEITTPGYNSVPEVFQEAFSKGELDL